MRGEILEGSPQKTQKRTQKAQKEEGIEKTEFRRQNKILPHSFGNPNGCTVDEGIGGVLNDGVRWLPPRDYFDLRAEIAAYRALNQIRYAVLHQTHLDPCGTEEQGIARNRDGIDPARQPQVRGNICAWQQLFHRVIDLDLGQERPRRRVDRLRRPEDAGIDRSSEVLIEN
jgi:hypothetical protein